MKDQKNFILKMFENSSSGMSLVEVVIAAGMVAGMGAIMMKSQSNHLKSMSSIETDSKFEDVREYVRSYFSCKNTDHHAVLECGPVISGVTDSGIGTSINIFSLGDPSTAPVMIKIPDTVVSPTQFQLVGKKYKLRASCQGADSDNIKIEVARTGINSGNNTLADKKLAFRDLFKGIPLSCPPLADIIDREEKTSRKWRWDDTYTPPLLIGTPNDEGEIDIEGCASGIPELRVNVIFDQSGSQNWNDPSNIRGIGAKLFISRLVEVKEKLPSANFLVHHSTFSSTATAAPLGWTEVGPTTLVPLEEEIDAITFAPRGGTIYSKAFELSETLFSGISTPTVDKRNIVIFMTDGQPNIQPIFVGFGNGETLANIYTAADNVVSNHKAAIFGVATGPSLPTWAEQIVNDISRPKFGGFPLGHIGYYIRALNEQDFRNSWDDIFEEISACDIRDCIDYGGSKKYTIETGKKKKKGLSKKKKAAKNIVNVFTDYDSPRRPDGKKGKSGDECFRYIGIKPVGSICISWKDSIGECIDTPWPDTCSDWNARMGVCNDGAPPQCSSWDNVAYKCLDPKPATCLSWDPVKVLCNDAPPPQCADWDDILAICNDPAPATCSAWNPYTVICEDPTPIGCGDWDPITATCLRIECHNWDAANLKCDSIEADCVDWDPSADVCTDDVANCNAGDWDPAGSCGAALPDCTSWNGTSCDDIEGDCNSGDWASTGMPSCQAAQVDCGAWEVAAPMCKDPGPP